MTPHTHRWLRLAAVLSALVVVGGVLALVLPGDSHHAKHPPAVGAKGLSGPRVLYKGTSHCYVPPGQGHPGVCAPAPKAGLRGPLRLGTGHYGADVSNYQGCVDPRGLSFIIAKVGEGAGFYDRYGSCTWHKARGRGIPAGVYYFARNTMDPRSAARRAVSWAGGLLSSLPLMLDYETNDAGLSGGRACTWIRSFVAEARAASGLVLIGVYDAPGLWPGCGAIPGAVGWPALLNGCHGGLSGLVTVICQWTFHGPYGGDGDVFMRGTPSQLVAASHAQPAPRPVPPPSARARRVCRFLLHYRRGLIHRRGHPTRWEHRNYRVGVRFMRRNHLSCEWARSPHVRRVHH